jgi:hypothetical protein
MEGEVVNSGGDGVVEVPTGRLPWAVAILVRRRGGPSFSWRAAVTILGVTPAGQ